MTEEEFADSNERYRDTDLKSKYLSEDW